MRRLFPAWVSLWLLGACSGQGVDVWTQANAASSPGGAAAVAPVPRLPSVPVADPAVRPESFAAQGIATRRDLAELFYAVSGQPVDAAKEAADAPVVKSQYDEAKKKETTAQLAAQIGEGARRIAANPLLRYRVVQAEATLGPYDVFRKGFPLRAVGPASRITFMRGFDLARTAADYSLVFSNGADFDLLRVEDEATARKIEQLRANTPLALTGSLRVYVFVQEAAIGPGPGQLIAQVLRVDLIGGNKELLASSGPARARSQGAGNVAESRAGSGKS
jgi:hypothetical protein